MKQLFVGRLRLGAGEDFSESRVVSERIPFPTRPQIGKRDAFKRVIHRKRSCEQALYLGNGFVDFAGTREYQSLKRLYDCAFDYVSGDW